MALLIDISMLDEHGSNAALEAMHKALSGEDGVAHDIFAPHESPFIRHIIELFYRRGLTRIEHVQTELNAWLSGANHRPSDDAPTTPPGYMARWSSAELGLVKLYLENLPPNSLSMDDWSIVVDYLVQRYLPVEELNPDAEWLAVKSHLMGKVQAHINDVSQGVGELMATALPISIADAAIQFKLSDATLAILSYGRARACDMVQAVSESTRHRLKRVVLDYEARRLAGDEHATTGLLQQQLFDEFGSLNRDWRRIAVTEAGEMANQGVIASLPEGALVRRMEMYDGACPFCKKLDGKSYEVVSASSPYKDGNTQVWPGKTNLGRSASPRKRVGSILVHREPDEKWWAPAGTVHPHCRGRWEPMAAPNPGDDPDFAAWLRARMGVKHGTD